MKRLFLLSAALLFVVSACAEVDHVKMPVDNTPPPTSNTLSPYLEISLQDLQNPWGPGLLDPGTPVSVNGIITAIEATGSFWIQSGECGPFTGIYVVNTQGAELLSPGQSVTVEGLFEWNTGRPQVVLDAVTVHPEKLRALPPHWLEMSAFEGHSGELFVGMVVGIQFAHVTAVEGHDGVLEERLVLSDKLGAIGFPLEQGGIVYSAIGVLHKEDGRYHLVVLGDEDLAYIPPTEMHSPDVDPPVADLPGHLERPGGVVIGTSSFLLPNFDIPRHLPFVSTLCETPSPPPSKTSTESVGVTLGEHVLGITVPQGVWDSTLSVDEPTFSGKLLMSRDHKSTLSLLWTCMNDCGDVDETITDALLDRARADYEQIYGDAVHTRVSHHGAQHHLEITLIEGDAIETRSLLVVEYEPGWERAAMCWMEVRSPGLERWSTLSESCRTMKTE